MSRKFTAIGNKVHTRIYVTRIRRPYMIMHAYTRKAQPPVIFLVSFPTFVSDSIHQSDCFRYIYVTPILSVASVKLYFICKLFFVCLSLGTSRPFVHPSYLLPYPILANAALKYLCAQISGFRAWSNRSYRTRERRGPINIKPPDQIAFQLKKKEEKKRTK